MSFAWMFKEAGPGDRARESQVEKFFNSDAVANRANAIVREGIQNSLDAAENADMVRVRIARGLWSAAETEERLPKYMKGFNEHFNVEAVRSKVANPPLPDEQFRYLLFEDFGTSGLKGDPALWWLPEHGNPNHFFNFFRAEGISDKTEGARGRHGVGRLVFMFASRVHSIFGLTRRGEETVSEELLMGTSVLRNHSLDGTPYLADAWFGVRDEKLCGLILPIPSDDPFVTEFKRDFGVSRQSENGLSVIVPWLSQEVTVEEIVKAVLAGYFYPILRKELVIEVVGESGEKQEISAHTIDSIVNAQADDVAAQMKPIIALARASLTITEPVVFSKPAGMGAPKWDVANIPEESQQAIHSKLEAGELVAIRAPMQIRYKDGEKPISDCHFDVFLQRDPNVTDGGQIQFIREGIIITDVRHRRTSGVRALVVIDEGPLASFLGDSENPSHTEWQSELVRDKYSFQRATIDYVAQSVPSILSIVSQQQKKPDTSLLIDLFSLPSDGEAGPKAKQKKQQKKDGEETREDELNIPRIPKQFFISKRAGGFVVRPGDPEAKCPRILLIKVAYGTRRGNPFTKYNRADFLLGQGGIEFEPVGCSVIDHDDNSMRVRVDEREFEIAVTGFDTDHRDLHVDVKVKEDSSEVKLGSEREEVADAAAS